MTDRPAAEPGGHEGEPGGHEGEPGGPEAGPGPANRRWDSWGLLALAAVFIVGAMSGLVATLLHRVVAFDLPAGLVGALAVAAVSGMLARAAADFGGVLLNAAALLIAILALTYLGGGTNVLVADDNTSLFLLLGVPVLAVLVPALTPRSWYGDA